MATHARERPTTATIGRIVITVVVTLVMLYAIYLIRNIVVLVFVAIFLAVGLDPAVRRLERMGLTRGQGVAAIFLSVIGVIVAFAFAVIPPLVRQVASFATDLPQYVQDLAEQNPRIEEWIAETDISEQLSSSVSNIPATISGSLGNVLGIAGSILGTLFNLLTILILTVYFLLSLSRIRTESMRLVPASRRHQVSQLVDPILGKIGGYIAGQVTVALIAGVLAFLFLAIVGVPFPVALALWVSIAALIPLVGATLGAIPAVVVAFFGSTALGVGTLGYFVIYQSIENYVIHPRVMTHAVDISPAAVLLAALIGGSLLGFVGALMAIPAAASIKLIFQEIVVPQLEAR
jgi:predicted PurR-regulated permease PerM